MKLGLNPLTVYELRMEILLQVMPAYHSLLLINVLIRPLHVLGWFERNLLYFIYSYVAVVRVGGLLRFVLVFSVGGYNVVGYVLGTVYHFAWVECIIWSTNVCSYYMY